MDDEEDQSRGLKSEANGVKAVVSVVVVVAAVVVVVVVVVVGLRTECGGTFLHTVFLLSLAP